MYLLSNIQDRNYWEEYPNTEGIIFDISDKELKNRKHRDWLSIEQGSIVCVILSSKKVSTFYRVTEVIETEKEDDENGRFHALTGDVVAKFDDRDDVTQLLNKMDVKHANLPKNKIGVSFKIADLGSGLDDLDVKTAGGVTQKLGELKAS